MPSPKPTVEVVMACLIEKIAKRGKPVRISEKQLEAAQGLSVKRKEENGDVVLWIEERK